MFIDGESNSENGWFEVNGLALPGKDSVVLCCFQLFGISRAGF
jgi:hypothetical protein